MQFRASILRRLGVLLSTILLVVASFALSASPAAAETYTVKMGADSGRLQFDPSQLTVSAGDTIKWVNNKLGPHNVIFSKPQVKGLSHKKLLFGPGDSYESKIPAGTAPGTYQFFCQPHRGARMVGKLTIQ
ncbi:MAG: plastocyanin [Symploca sp. SIO2G7]|nr:plastocyanin [Symploca sp. SIO2G7]